MGKPIDKKDTDQRTVTEYLRDTNPTAYAAMMRRETVQPSTTLTNVGFVAPDDWFGIKADIAEDRLSGVMLNGPNHYDSAEYDDAAVAAAAGRKFAAAVEKIAKTGTQAPSYLGSPTTLQNFDAFVRARLRELYPETDGVPPPPLAPNPFLSMIKKERSHTPYKIESTAWKLPLDAKVEKVPTPGDSTETWRRWRERFEASREACATCGGTGEVTRADS